MLRSHLHNKITSSKASCDLDSRPVALAGQFFPVALAILVIKRTLENKEKTENLQNRFIFKLGNK